MVPSINLDPRCWYFQSSLAHITKMEWTTKLCMGYEHGWHIVVLALLTFVTIHEAFPNECGHLMGKSSSLACWGDSVHFNEFKINLFFQQALIFTLHQFKGVYKYFSMEMIFVDCPRIADSLPSNSSGWIYCCWTDSSKILLYNWLVIIVLNIKDCLFIFQVQPALLDRCWKEFFQTSNNGHICLKQWQIEKKRNQK